MKEKKTKQNQGEVNPLIDPIIPALRSFALVTAVRLGIFNAIHEGAHTCQEMASYLNIDPTGTERLAEALVVLGYLGKSQTRFYLTEVSRETLLYEGSLELHNWVRFSQIQSMAGIRLEDVLRTGEPVDIFSLMNTDQDRLTHQRAMAETAKPAASWIAEEIVPPRGALRILDIGGSHGVYSAALCKHYPPMKSTVYELPHMLSYAKAISKEYGTDQYCTHLGKDIMKEDIDSDYDLVFLGNILHHFREEEAKELLSKIYNCLTPKGGIAIWDLAQDEEHPDPTTSLFSLLFYISSGTKCYSAAEVKALLSGAGFLEFHRSLPSGGGTHCLYTGVKELP